MDYVSGPVASWAAFGTVIGLAVWYYTPKNPKTTPSRPASTQETKKESKKAGRKNGQTQSQPSYANVVKKGEPRNQQSDNSIKKRKATPEPATQKPVAQRDEDEIDMSTRQFAASMQKAREGIKMNSSNKKEARVKTVRPRQSPTDTPTLSSASSQVDDVEDGWTLAKSAAPQAGGVDDMLEPTASGPSSLRITAAEKPVKEKVVKQPKKEVVESKKARQNRQKAERQKLERQEADAEQKILKERQMRLARESRGEPAKNGIPIASAPVRNPWAERNAARDAHSPAVSNTGSNIQLLDTLDTESNSSSNQEDSTAATSTTDAAPGQSTDFTEGDLARAIEESERDSGWSEVKTKKQLKKKTSNSDNNGNITPVAAPVANGKINAYSALGDEAD